MSYALGIDLGTTYSAAAVARNSQAEILSLGYRSPTLPSVIVARASGEILIGEAAERRAMIEPLRTAREFKRRLGDPTPILLGSAPYGAETLMSYLLRGIYDLVVEQQGETPSSLVISHPANWGLYKLDLLEQAVRMADVGNSQYITEPVAAALHYAGRERIDPGEIVAVYDFGGGTFDAALLRRTESSFEQLGDPEGIERLGGIDFDEAVFGHVMQSLGDLVEDLDPSDSTAMTAVARLRDECREAKEILSVDTDVTIPVMLPGVQTEVRLTRSEFEEMVEPRIGATIAAFKRAVRSADLDLGDVDRILLVGGSSRIPLVRQRVREETDSEIFLDAHPKYAIALGAAIAADLDLGTSISAQMAALAAPRVAPAEPVQAPAPPPVEEAAPPLPPVVLPIVDLEPVIAPETIEEEPVPSEPEVMEPETGELEAPVVEPEAPVVEVASPSTEVEASTATEPQTDEIPAVEAVPPPPEPRPSMTDTGEHTAPVNAKQVASSQWQDGITISPALIAALGIVLLGSAVVTFLLLTLVAG